MKSNLRKFIITLYPTFQLCGLGHSDIHDIFSVISLIINLFLAATEIVEVGLNDFGRSMGKFCERKENRHILVIGLSTRRPKEHVGR
jgi:hypothetical protein